MIDVAIAGTRGFIGGYLLRDLRARGLTVEEEPAFRRSGERCALFINCSNNPTDPAANVALTASKMELARLRCDAFLQFMSFITLVGRGEQDASAFNFGFKPATLDYYAAGKLEQEAYIQAHYRSLSAKTVTLAYLPIVLGDGGGWSALLAQAARKGVALPAGIGAAARANHVHVAQIADYAASLVTARTRRDFQRVIVNDAKSARVDWEQFFADAPRLAPVTPSPKARVRAAVEGRVLGLLHSTGQMAHAAALVRRVRKPRPYVPAGPAAAKEEPVRFGGTMLPVIRTQPYLPG